MTTAQAWIGYGGTLALATVLAGVLVRGHYRIWWFFSLFLAVTLVSTVMILAWPSRFYTTHFWQAKETVLNFVRFAMALELAPYGVRSNVLQPGVTDTPALRLIPGSARTHDTTGGAQSAGRPSERRNNVE